MTAASNSEFSRSAKIRKQQTLSKLESEAYTMQHCRSVKRKHRGALALGETTRTAETAPSLHAQLTPHLANNIIHASAHVYCNRALRLFQSRELAVEHPFLHVVSASRLHPLMQQCGTAFQKYDPHLRIHS